jgi:plasmid maintenance system antidote protein VapI
MRHYSAAQIIPEHLLTEEEIVVDLAARLDGRRGENGRLADQLGITRVELSRVLNGSAPLRPGIACTLGYRRVTRFERILPHPKRMS